MGQSRKLRKSRNKWLDGVLGGLGEYFQVNPDLLRVGFIILVALNFQIVIAGYFILMIFMPGRKRVERVDDANFHNEANEHNEYNQYNEDEEYWDDDDDDYDYDDDYEEVPANPGRSLQFFGGLLVFIGIYVLFQDQVETYTRYFYSQFRRYRYYLAPYREVVFASVLILAGGLLWWKGRK